MKYVRIGALIFAAFLFGFGILASVMNSGDDEFRPELTLNLESDECWGVQTSHGYWTQGRGDQHHWAKYTKTTSGSAKITKLVDLEPENGYERVRGTVLLDGPGEVSMRVQPFYRDGSSGKPSNTAYMSCPR